MSTEHLGVFRTADLAALGWSRHRIRAAVDDGSLRRHAPGLFFIPLESPTDGQRWLQRAALRTRELGADAVLARSTAAALHGLDGFDRRGSLIECNTSVRTGGRLAADGVRRATPLDPPEMVEGLPVTGIGQTLVELGSTLAPSPLPPADRVELAVECALHRLLVTVGELEDVLADAGRRRGAATLRTVLRRRPEGAPPTESYLETRLVQLLRDHGLPTPQRQVELRDGDGFIGRVDLLIGRVAIEVDGRATHDGATAFHRDRLRWSRLQAAGYRPLVFTHVQIERTPAVVAAIVGDTLAIAA